MPNFKLKNATKITKAKKMISTVILFCKYKFIKNELSKLLLF